MERILLVEDDRDLARQVLTALVDAGYVADVAVEGEEALERGRLGVYGAAILDLGLPRLDGLSVLKSWRKFGVTFPVLILSARETWRDKVTGLRAGADDYLAKPFAMDELLARLEALLRRGSSTPQPACGALLLDQAARRVLLHGEPLRLTAMEYRLLASLLLHRDRVVSKAELAERVYEQGVEGESNSLEVLILRLRKKVGAERIVTHRGLGYRLADPEGGGP